jgi:hypothetical protein
MTADVTQGQTCDRASPGAILRRFADGSRLPWALPSPVHERLGLRAMVPDRIQGDAVLPHTSRMAQSRITSRHSSRARTSKSSRPEPRPNPPDSWRSIGFGLGSGIPPPVPKHLLTNRPSYKGRVARAERGTGGVRCRKAPPPGRSARASRPPSPASRRRDRPEPPQLRTARTSLASSESSSPIAPDV